MSETRPTEAQSAEKVAFRDARSNSKQGELQPMNETKTAGSSSTLVASAKEDDDDARSSSSSERDESAATAPPPKAPGKNVKFVCTLCKKEFGTKGSLKTHNRVHTGEKPFTCPIPGCGRSFSQHPNCIRHIRLLHPGLDIKAISNNVHALAKTKTGKRLRMQENFVMDPTLSGAQGASVPTEAESVGVLPVAAQNGLAFVRPDYGTVQQYVTKLPLGSPSVAAAAPLAAVRTRVDQPALYSTYFTPGQPILPQQIAAYSQAPQNISQQTAMGTNFYLARGVQQSMPQVRSTSSEFVFPTAYGTMPASTSSQPRQMLSNIVQQPPLVTYMQPGQQQVLQQTQAQSYPVMRGVSFNSTAHPQQMQTSANMWMYPGAQTMQDANQRGLLSLQSSLSPPREREIR